MADKMKKQRQLQYLNDAAFERALWQIECELRAIDNDRTARAHREATAEIRDQIDKLRQIEEENNAKE